MKPSKYGNKKTKVDGIIFHSKREAKRYQDLCLLERAGKITELTLQPRFNLEGKNGELKYASGRRAQYVADFSYVDEEGKRIIEDSKGFRTDVYKLKRAIMEAMGFKVYEV